MSGRYRFGRPALLIAGGYILALAVAAVIALTTGGLGALWRLTLFAEMGEGVAVTWQNVLILVLVGMPWAWALWQSLRGPLAGPPPELDRDTRRLRVGLYAAVVSWLLYAVMPFWPWWAVALDAVVMGAVVMLFHQVLGRNLAYADPARTAGVLAYGGIAAIEVFDVLDWPLPGVLIALCGLAGLVWTVLILRAQWRDGRWQRATVRYGIASLVVPLVLGLVGGLLTSMGNVYSDAKAAADVLMMIWLARSAHDLADPHHEPAPSEPLPAHPATP
ncbi:hypothetical protein [Acrocarpospora catenulata]|uniref:hypothetical protein n=1 Tax=Acrocarpospora catenulata TaxID=2836182 RepID=UPI001BD960A9|nr:hypothetical protein [Acrocarpospora catenulata]